MKITPLGFTLVEVLIFIVVSSLAMTVILLGATTGLRSMPNVHHQWVALNTAKSCMEWYLMQRRLIDYSTLACPGTPSAGLCTAPSGFSVSTSVSCTTWNSDTNFKTITVNVSGLSSASLSAQIGDY